MVAYEEGIEPKTTVHSNGILLKFLKFRTLSWSLAYVCSRELIPEHVIVNCEEVELSSSFFEFLMATPSTPTSTRISGSKGSKRLGWGVRLQSQSKEIVANVYKYFERLHSKEKSTGPFKRTIEATV